ncbi:hypothetical protein GPLA_2921 [Paraglaciecola polaris LMG 21857]|uniref:Uncharacterized protein n=1 Tax=Paraglaciecola polaris LMG 21857 TaxID=1129793 RepID=K6YMB5_9ALTE|nr:hypothetical protein GPLA_2921 [Paraglaciecola polaris LMG 21857]
MHRPRRQIYSTGQNALVVLSFFTATLQQSFKRLANDVVKPGGICWG